MTWVKSYITVCNLISSISVYIKITFFMECQVIVSVKIVHIAVEHILSSI